MQRSIRVLPLLSVLCVVACAEPIEGDWEVRSGPVCFDDACTAEVDLPFETSVEGCDLEVAEFIGIADDLDGRLTVRTKGINGCPLNETLTYTISEIDEVGKNERYDVTVLFPNHPNRVLDCDVGESSMTCNDDAGATWKLDRI